MKIGIITFWWSDNNYGQILQCYALQKYLRDKGHEVYLIRYDPRNDYINKNNIFRILKALNPIKLFNYLKYKIRLIISNFENKRFDRGFYRFIENNIVQSNRIYKSYLELKNNYPEADAYIVGSDQVWNFGESNVSVTRNLIHAYFLDFGPDNLIRGSYAASWGKTDINNELVKEITPLIKKLNYVTVREKSGISICKKCGKDAQWVPDPTLLLKPDVYRKLYQTVNIKNKKKDYIFIYLLYNKSVFSFKELRKWAKERDLDIIYVTGNDKIDFNKKYYATIYEWLALIDNAKYVITNSYHGCIFSFIFNKKFLVLPLKNSYKEMNTRLDSLWEIMECKPRLLENNKFDLIFEEMPMYEYNRIKEKFNVFLDDL